MRFYAYINYILCGTEQIFSPLTAFKQTTTINYEKIHRSLLGSNCNLSNKVSA